MRRRILTGSILVLITALGFYFLRSRGQGETPWAPYSLYLPRINQIRSGPVTTPSHTPTFTRTPTPTATSTLPPTPTSTRTPIVVAGTDWPMVASNPQRTSWTSNAVDANNLEWYRVIEAYIPQHVQVIAASTTQYPQGLLFISSARGLYAFRADTGAVVWRFDTEMPLGNSPAFSQDVIYVGGFDRKLYALNANTGARYWEFTGAKAGYDTNPLVVEGKVILGNRDGAVYAIGAQGTPNAGQQVWKYQTGGPVRFSAAYLDGAVYIVSNDGYVYSLQASDGTRIWKSSPQMGGDGFNSYWPVVYSDPLSGNHYIIVVGSEGYRAFVDPGDYTLQCDGYEWCRWLDLFNGDVSGQLGEPIDLDEPWVNGREAVSFLNTIMEYLSTDPAPHPHYHKPWNRLYYIFNAQDGQEYTLNSKSGYPTYAPIIPVISNSGNPYPPVVGADQLLYMGNHQYANGQSLVMGWRFGTPYMVIQGLQGAGDEPWSLSAGGNLIYRSICCDRSASMASIDWTNYLGYIFWSYDLYERAPGYDEMWWGADPNHMARLTGNFGKMPDESYSVNGVYHEHGDQSPLVPFRGRVYALKSNALLAFGPAGGSPTQLTKLTAVSVPATPDTRIGATELKRRLETEIQKILNAGHLRPGYYNAGQFNQAYPELVDYFSAPGDTLYALSVAYPHVNSTLQQQLKTYLKSEFQNYFVDGPFGHIGWQDGVSREWLPLPPEISAVLDTFPKGTVADAYNVYGLWKYAQIVAPEDASQAYEIAGQIWDNAPVMDEPYRTNRLVAGRVGYNGLALLTGHSGNTTVTTCSFSKDTPYQDITGHYVKRVLNISRNFLFLVPELGECLSKNTQVASAIEEYEWLGPYWFVSRYTASIGESTNQNLYDYPSLFAARAYILKQPQEELVKYMDVPAFYRGDLYYIRNLVAALEAP